ncbi:hypothetical protein FHY25_000717 [Xanthomonas arboricola]|nr:hypothetical protein [Xanthomonas campestris]MCW2006136.1 hypothetical protein [Xanthomonas campestris]
MGGGNLNGVGLRRYGEAQISRSTKGASAKWHGLLDSDQCFSRLCRIPNPESPTHPPTIIASATRRPSLASTL